MGRRVWVAKDSLRTTAEELQKIVESRAQKTLKKIVKQPLHPVRESQSSATITITWSTWLLSTATSFLITSTCQHSSAPLYLHSLHTPSSSGLPFTTPNSHQTQNYLPVPLTFQILLSSRYTPSKFPVGSWIPLSYDPAKRHFHQSTAKTPLNCLHLRIPHLPVSPHDLHLFHLSINCVLSLTPCLLPVCCDTSPNVVREGFKKNSPSSSEQQTSIFSYHSDTTGTSNGTCFYGQMKQKNELFSSKHSRWVWWTRG